MAGPLPSRLRVAVALALLAAAGPARPEPALRPLAHLGVGVGACPSVSGGSTGSCPLFATVEAGFRAANWQLTGLYEGPLALEYFTATVVPDVSSSAMLVSSWVGEPTDRLRVSVGAEIGRRRYAGFAQGGWFDALGVMDALCLGVRGQAAFGVRAEAGPSLRFAASLSVRRDLVEAEAVRVGNRFQIQGTSISFSLGLLSDW